MTFPHHNKISTMMQLFISAIPSNGCPQVAPCNQWPHPVCGYTHVCQFRGNCSRCHKPGKKKGTHCRARWPATTRRNVQKTQVAGCHIARQHELYLPHKSTRRLMMAVYSCVWEVSYSASSVWDLFVSCKASEVSATSCLIAVIGTTPMHQLCVRHRCRCVHCLKDLYQCRRLSQHYLHSTISHSVRLLPANEIELYVVGDIELLGPGTLWEHIGSRAELVNYSTEPTVRVLPSVAEEAERTKLWRV
jgi:hypothetical protein